MVDPSLMGPEDSPGSDPDELNHQIVGLIDMADGLEPRDAHGRDIKKRVVDLLAKASGLMALYDQGHDDTPTKDRDNG